MRKMMLILFFLLLIHGCSTTNENLSSLKKIEQTTDVPNIHKEDIKDLNANKIKDIQTNPPAHKTRKLLKKQKKVPKKEEKELVVAASMEKPFSYYAKDASLDELTAYLSYKYTKNSLSYNQYQLLKERVSLIEEEKLLNEGSLEELIAAYKIDKDPKYKNRIISLMKDTQENQ